MSQPPRNTEVDNYARKFVWPYFTFDKDVLILRKDIPANHIRHLEQTINSMIDTFRPSSN